MRRHIVLSVVSALALSSIASSPVQEEKPKPWESRGYLNSIQLSEYKSSVKNKVVTVKIAKKNVKVACFPKQSNSGKRTWVPGVNIGTDTQGANVYWASYADQAAYYKERATQTLGKQKAKNKKISDDFAKRAKSSSAESKACKTVAVMKLSSKNLAGLAVVSTSASSFRSFRSEEFGIRNLFGSTTNLAGLDDNGVLVSALGSSSVNVQELVEAPDGSIYILFSNKVDLLDPDGAMYGWQNQQSSCAFAVAKPNSTAITCVDNQVQNLRTGTVQFDNSGRVYYVASLSCDTNCNSSEELRRATGSSISTMVRPTNGRIDNFRVSGDGYLIVRGWTGSNSWVRTYSPERVAKEIGSNSWGGLFDIFPDGNLYFASEGEILKFDTNPSVLAVNPRSWIGQSGSRTNPEWVVENPWNIAQASDFYRLPMGQAPVSDDRVYVVYSQYNPISKKAAQVYPTVIPDLQVGLTDTQVIEPAGNFLAVSGKNVVRNGAQTTTTYKTTILNGADQSYRDASGMEGIEVFSMTYATSSNELIVNGEILRTGVKVNGKYNLTTNTWVVTSSNTGRIDDLELFDN
jgi:hypothetical protein